MASAIDIVNLALSHLGDTATVSSIDPPEGSAQAEHAARFYPIARDSLQEMHEWGFGTRSTKLALLSGGRTQWRYCYAQPTGVLSPIAVLPPDAIDDQAVAYPLAYTLAGTVGASVNIYTPQEFVSESLDDDTAVIYTNQQDAVLRYTRLVTDTTKFTPLFVDALSRLLASYLAGPILKGDAGRAEAREQYKIFLTVLARATTSDASQQLTRLKQSTPFITGR